MELKGKVIAKIFESADGYAVVEIDGDEPTVVVGMMPHIKTGELTRFFGEYKTHPRYGRQFVCETYESVQPAEPEDMIAFLASDFVKGLGEVLATRLVTTFGEKTFQVIEHEPERLVRVKGISAKLAANLHETFVDYAQSKYRYAELMGLGLTARQAARAAEVLGGDAADRIRRDPYILMRVVRGIDFQRADRVARQLGVAEDSPVRAARAIEHVLRKTMQQLGDMCIARERLIPHVAENIGSARDVVEEGLMELCRDQDVCLRTYRKSPRDREAPALVFLRPAYDAEAYIAAQLTRLMRSEPEYIHEDPADFDMTARMFQLSEEQKNAVLSAWSNPVTVVTGGPGTGKTTIIKAALQMFGRAGLKCALAAPTGRAAKRIQEATDEDASTLHRLLEFTYSGDDGEEAHFQRNEEHPLETDVLIVDEMSMVDAFLFRSLLRGVESGTRVVLIGDADQLPSVGPGNVLRDLIDSQCVPTQELTYHFRNAGRIADGAHRILQGEIPEFDDREFVFLERSSSEEIRKAVRDLYVRAWKAGREAQVLAPIKRSELGSVALNNMLREAVNPRTETVREIVRGDRIYREGDRVMQITNDYTRHWRDDDRSEEGEGVFNGDMGTIELIEGGEVRIQFDDGRTSWYGTDEMDALDGAFAYTVHKSQGSEFDMVILPMHYGRNPFLSRSLLYTAVTRARRRVVVVGSRGCFDGMVRNDVRSQRKTGLKEELRTLRKAVQASA